MTQDIPVQIAEIEARIERLTEERERAEKAVVLARLALWGGALLLLGVFGGLILANRVEIAVVAVGLFIGGIVVAGSSRATALQIRAGIEKLESARAEAIDELDLAFVRPNAQETPTLH